MLGAVAWAAAFGFTWVSRWAFGAAFLGLERTIDMVKQNVGFRTSGSSAGVTDSFGAGIARNVSYWWEHVPTAHVVLISCIAAALIGLVLAVRRGGAERLVVAAVLTMPAAVVPFWYLAVSNHSQIHAFFVNRGVPTVLAVVTAACLLAAALPASPGSRLGRRPRSVPAAADTGGRVERRDPYSTPRKEGRRP